MNDQAAVRAVIVQALIGLRQELGQFEQTTQPPFWPYPVGIDTVLDELAACWNTPSAYRISHLSQAIDAMISQHHALKAKPP